MTDPAPSRRALDPPDDAVVAVGDGLIRAVLAASRESPRRRMVLPLHRTNADPLQRMLNAIQPGSYVRPHRHPPPVAESLVVLRGALRFIVFDDAGEIRRAMDLGAGRDVGVDIVPGVYHTIIALADDTVMYEVKTGPFRPAADKNFAAWAPAEASRDAAAYLRELIARTAPPSGARPG